MCLSVCLFTTLRTEYAAGGMPLAVTQEDFLVQCLHLVSLVNFPRQYWRSCLRKQKFFVNLNELWLTLIGVGPFRSPLRTVCVNVNLLQVMQKQTFSTSTLVVLFCSSYKSKSTSEIFACCFCFLIKSCKILHITLNRFCFSLPFYVQSNHFDIFPLTVVSALWPPRQMVKQQTQPPTQPLWKYILKKLPCSNTVNTWYIFTLALSVSPNVNSMAKFHLVSLLLNILLQIKTLGSKWCNFDTVICKIISQSSLSFSLKAVLIGHLLNI